MVEKVVFTLIISFVSTSLFAFSFAKGDTFLYPTVGFGASSASCTAWKGYEMGNKVYGDETAFDDPETEVKFAYNVGLMFDHYFSNTLALTAGVTYDSTPAELRYPANEAAYDGDLYITAEYKLLTIPVGLHYVFNNLVIVGGGLFYSIVQDDEVTIKDNVMNIEKTDVKSQNFPGFFVDLGLNVNISQDNHLLIYARYKQALSEVSEGDWYIEDVKIQSLMLNVAFGIRI